MKIITRFPPSPTGKFHIGSARTALFNYLFAKKEGGEMLLRFEDTDTARSKKEFEEDILEGLEWLGLEYQFTGRQSERTETYTKYIEKMLEEGSAYEGEESKDTGEKVIRFKNPNKEIRFEDQIRGEISFDTTELEDFVIAKGKKHPLYHLTVVVDDFESEITHVIRGEDHISNTPRQILIAEAIGAPRPTYAHIPLILAPDKSKMSKRAGAVSVTEYKEAGYLPEALVNFLALLGWNPGDEREIFSMDDLTKEFSLERVQKSPAIFNIEKLNDINKHYIKALDLNDFKRKILGEIPVDIKNLEDFSEDTLDKIIPLIQERVANTTEAQTELEELSFFFTKPLYEATKLAWKNTHKDKVKSHLDVIIEVLQAIDDNEFSSLSIKEKVWDYATEEGRGEVLWPVRYALSGKERSPDPFTIAEILGKKESLERLSSAKEALSRI